MKKIYVLDTNVILHDADCLNQFGRDDVVVPLPVIEELDKFKKGKDSRNVNARNFVKMLDATVGDGIFNGGVLIAEGKGCVSVARNRELHAVIKKAFTEISKDIRILNIAYRKAVGFGEKGFKQVVLVTKDVNLRLRAKAVGLMSQDHTPDDRTKSVENLYSGKAVIEGVSEDAIDLLYHAPYEVEASRLPEIGNLLANQFLIMRNGSKSALGFFDENTYKVRRIESKACFGIRPRNAEQSFALNALMNRDIPLVTLSGKAGTGKTLLALASSVESKQYFRQIFIARPIVPLSNKDIGYLPGDINSKLDPYMQPLYDNLSVIQNQFDGCDRHTRLIKELLVKDKIVITPLSYIRGRSIVKVFFIVDEAQNLTPHEVKTIITRAGEGTKLVFTGDIHQIDHPYLDANSNGLTYLIEKMHGQKLHAHINLEKGERSDLSDMAIKLL